MTKQQPSSKHPWATFVIALYFQLFLDCILPVRSFAGTVPSPFEPISAVLKNETLLVGLWGREYEFRSSPLPVSIRSQGKLLFVAPPEIEVQVGDADPHLLAFGNLTLRQHTPDAVEFETTAYSGTFRFRALTRIEYDGMIRIRIRATSTKPSVLRKFSYQFPIDSRLVEWFNHHVPYDYSAMNVDKMALLESAGRIPSGRSMFEFHPTFFIGGRKVGIEWWWETNLDWSRSVSDPPLEVVRSADSTSFRVTPISSPRLIQGRDSFEHEFALFPAPIRPTPDHWRSNRFLAYQAAPLFARRSDLKYYWIAFPKHFSALFHGLPGSRMDRSQRLLREKLKRLGVGYIPYSKLTATPSGHPIALAHADEWSANRQRFVVPPANERIVLERTTDWKPGQPFGYAVCAERDTYFDWIRNANLEALTRERLDGLYFDFGSISRMCERATTAPSVHSTSMTERVRPEFWHYFTIRRFYKELFEGMRQVAPDALLTIHTHGQPRSLSAWADYTFVGEALNVVFRAGHTFGEIAQNPSLYSPDYLALPEGWMEAMTFPNVGGIISWLPELKFAKDPHQPNRLRRFQRAFFAWVLVNDVHVWLGNGDFPEMVKIVAALDEFGSLDDSDLLPWWRNHDVFERDERLKITAYSRDSATLMIVSNLTEQSIASTIRIRTGLLKRAKPVRFSDLEQPGDRIWRSMSDSRFDIVVPARDFRILLLSP